VTAPGQGDPRPVVTFDPAVRFGYAHIKGIPTEAIADVYWAGETADAVADDYGLSRHELLVALWFEGAHGTYRDRWRQWAWDVAYPMLGGWRKPFDLDGLPLPPDRNGDSC
jgi:uncharacterized protein (DUF433 family)